MTNKETETVCPTSIEEWRLWLKKNHQTLKSVWVVFYKKNRQQPTISWSEAVDEALCFGWIDSVKKTIDSEKYQQFFSQRKPISTWSKINKEKIEQLTDKGLMSQAGFESVEIAKQNGSWIILDDVENLIIPPDLETEFTTKPNSRDYFLSLSKSTRKAILQWIVLAKRTETRQSRIQEIVRLAHDKQKPKQFG